MARFMQITGRLTEVHRYINVPMRWSEQYPSRERRELWITQRDGSEVKLVVHTREMPARSGHMITVLIWRGQVLGLSNLSTGALVNFAEVDPPKVFGRADGLRLLFIFGAASAGMATSLDLRGMLILIPLLAVLSLSVIFARMIGRGWLQTRVNRCLGRFELPSQIFVLRRVK